MSNQIRQQAIETIFERKDDMVFLAILAANHPEAVIQSAAKLEKCLDRVIIDLYASNKRIQAIKECRAGMGLGLREAKEYCDKISDWEPGRHPF